MLSSNECAREFHPHLKLPTDVESTPEFRVGDWVLVVLARKVKSCSMSFLNPKKWNVACWLLLLLWLFVSASMNAPFEPKLTDWESIGVLPDGSRFAVYDAEFLIGWPFEYCRIATNGSGPSTRTYNPGNAILNIVFVASTLISLIYAVQHWMPQFSIRTMMVGTAVVASLIAIGQAIFLSESYSLMLGFTMSVYFSPVVAALAFWGYDALRREKQSRDDCR